MSDGATNYWVVALGGVTLFSSETKIQGEPSIGRRRVGLDAGLIVARFLNFILPVK